MTVPGPTRPTLTMIAEATGVSPSTVSRALRDDDRVAGPTGERIRRAAQEMGFRQNHMARALRLGGTATLLGLLIPDVADPFFAAIADAIQKEALAHGHQVIFGFHNDDPAVQDRLVKQMVAHRVSALMITPAPHAEARLLQQERDFGTSLVLIDRPVENLVVDMVSTENVRGAAQLAEALVERGHRRVAVLSLDQGIWTQRERLAAVRATLADHGITVPDEHVGSVPNDVAQWLRALMSGPDAPTALLSLSVVPLIRALLTREIPPDVELACFDTHPLFDLLPTPVVCVAQDIPAIGRAAVSRALAHLVDPSLEPETIELPLSPLHTRGREGVR